MKKNINVSQNKPAYIYMILLLSIILLSSNYSFFRKHPNYLASHSMLDNSFFVCEIFLYIILCVYHFHNQSNDKNELQELYSENQSLNAQLTLIKKRAVDLNHLMKIRHDVRAHYNAIYSLAKLERYDELIDYMTSIYDDLTSIDDYPPFICPVLACIIGKKKKEARSYGISFEYHITEKDLGMNSKDITIVFSNILSNAINAAKNSEQKHPMIELEIKKQHDIIIIHCKNSFNPALLKRKRNTYFTCKPDAKNHGFGLSIIENTLHHYHGSLNTSPIENNFFLSANYHCKKS